MARKSDENLSNHIADTIGERIIRGEIAPGARLLEVQLSADLGVSRGPVREALRILEKRRLAQILPRRGALVTPWSRDQVISLYEVLTPLYQLLARKTAGNWTPETLTPIYSVVEGLIASAESGDPDGYYERNLAFARACAPVAGNPLLHDLLVDFEASMRRVHYFSRDQRRAAMGRHLELLRQMMRHVTEREGEAAGQVIRVLAELELGLALEAMGEAAARPLLVS